MITNCHTTDFVSWYYQLTQVAITEYDIEITQLFHRSEFEKLYNLGMDVYEAIKSYTEKAEA